MAKPRQGDPSVNSIVPDQPEMPDEARRRDARIDRPDSLPETADDLERGGDSPSIDGDNPQHPLHDEDTEDLDPEDYENMMDEIGDGDLDPATGDRDEE